MISENWLYLYSKSGGTFGILHRLTFGGGKIKRDVGTVPIEGLLDGGRSIRCRVATDGEKADYPHPEGELFAVVEDCNLKELAAA